PLAAARRPYSPLFRSNIALDFPSVRAPENAMMAACLADGVTRLTNVAREPEIEDLAKFLNALGAQISGAGSDMITVVGVENLGGSEEHTSELQSREDV